jgi:hypothetical protein
MSNYRSAAVQALVACFFLFGTGCGLYEHKWWLLAMCAVLSTLFLYSSVSCLRAQGVIEAFREQFGENPTCSKCEALVSPENWKTIRRTDAGGDSLVLVCESCYRRIQQKQDR